MKKTKPTDRPVWGLSFDTQGHGRGHAYEIYILHGMWRSMEPHRMLHILNVMHRSNYSAVQKANIEDVRYQVMATLNSQVQVAA